MMDTKILLTVAYVGTRYCGYQVQPNGVTVQEMLNRAAQALFGYPCDVVGCSRTDSGIHARGFCAAVTKKGESSLITSVPPERVARAMNAHLPDDIAVLSSREVPASFHPRYDVVSKEYEYLIYNGRERDPFLRDRAWHIPTPIDEAALAAMQRAAADFVGTHDFSAFRAVGADTEPKDAVRTVFSASVTRQGDMISFRVRADGFLYNMVRIMAGTLVAVANGRIGAEAIPRLIEGRDRRGAGQTAPACGLYLDTVYYH
ncbi:MAG: tRNA pseudouridine(38-40) synthase TruA [Clostridia bacterium]|nr:tRNA pseudouridine(38-40) synthase TruA [Clostridia bacterium]